MRLPIVGADMEWRMRMKMMNQGVMMRFDQPWTVFINIYSGCDSINSSLL